MKLEFYLSLGVVGGVHELDAGKFSSSDEAASVAIDPATNHDPMVEPLRFDSVAARTPLPTMSGAIIPWIPTDDAILRAIIGVE